MANSKSIPPELHSALAIFVEELNNHVTFLTEIVNQLQSIEEERIEPISSSKAQQLANRFHRIKGGAGFLGLKEISDAASKAEGIFKEASVKEVSREILSQELAEILNSLKRANQELSC